MKRALVLALVLALLPACFSSRGGDTSASCPTDRSVELGLQEDVHKVAGCPLLQGIVVRTGAPIDLSPLKELEEISGDLTIGPTVGLDGAAFNELLRVGGTIRVASNNSLRGLFFPRVESIGRMEVESNVVLTTVSMPRVQTVRGALVIADNSSLELISAPLLQTVGKELVIAGHGQLNLVELGQLARAEAVRVEGNPKLAPEVVEQLTSKSSLHQPPTP
jgi:hypothetical protein